MIKQVDKIQLLTKDIFYDTATAFATRSDAELEKAYWLFSIIKREPLVRLSTAVTNFALKYHLPVEGIIRSTVFEHFCGGVTEEDTLPVVEKLYRFGVYSILDYSVEGAEDEASFERVFNKTKHLIEFASKRKEIPFAVFKPTGLGAFRIYEKISAGAILNPEEQQAWERIKNRYETLATVAYEHNVPIMVDAEESWMQKAVDDLLEDLMLEFNRKHPTVVTTLQMYRKDRLDYLKALYERLHSKGVITAVKFVRGAYMEKERERAEQMGYPSPICDTKADTDKQYNEGIRFAANHIDDFFIYNGTHNEDSALLLANILLERGLPKNHPHAWFGQLYGMSDHITFNLAKYGFNTSKYIPFGPVKDVIPYLIRRAEENTSVAGQTSRELRLLEMERKRRKI